MVNFAASARFIMDWIDCRNITGHLCQITQKKEKIWTQPPQNLMKIGTFVYCDPTARYLKF